MRLAAYGSCLGVRSVRKDGDSTRVVLARLSFHIGIGCTLAGALGSGPTVAAKPIHLHHGTIATADSSDEAARAAVEKRGEGLKGLYLIQCTGPFHADWKRRLEDVGVHVLRYVPEDTFVTRMRGVSPASIEALPFVQWVGPYNPEYKVHRTLAPSPNAANRSSAPTLRVSILLAGNSPDAELGHVRGLLHKLEQEGHNRFGSTLRGTLSANALTPLIASPAVLWVEPFRNMQLFDEVSTKIVAGDGGPNQSTLQAHGIDGSGVTIGVADSGLHNGDAATMHPDLFGRVKDFFYYGGLTDASDEHSHGTHVAGIVAGNGAVQETDENGALYGLGVAPGAHIVAQRLFDATGGFHAPPTFEQLTRDAVRSGAEVGCNSWGDDQQGRYDTVAAEFDALVRDADALTAGDQPYILEFSAGNAGPGEQTIGTPAVAKNVIASGASQNNRPDFFLYAEGPEAMADFSSRGPTEDGRIKPDVVAPGTWIASLQSASAGDDSAWSPISPHYQYQGGTSQSGPHVAGAAALFVQYYRLLHDGRTPSPALVKAALINTAVDLDDAFGTTSIPNHGEGWGRVDLTSFVDSERRFQLVNQSELLTTGTMTEQRVIIAGTNAPLKVTLTYTDVPGFPGAIPALVNDLDLEVVDPAGNLYRGNQFAAGEAIPQAPHADRVNNVEGIHIHHPLRGEYTVRVRAYRVAEDARIDTPEVDQDFALVVSGEIPAAGQGLIFLDRRVYRAPDTIHVRVIDPDRAGQATVDVAVHSTSDATNQTIVLRPAATPGSFTGSVQTLSHLPQETGTLHVAHADTVVASYIDHGSNGAKMATAEIDLWPPVITGVQTTNAFGHTIVQWQTDEPTRARVRYGTNALLTETHIDPVLRMVHEATLTDLTPEATYVFLISAEDEAGNTATNDNGGALFHFLAPAPAAVLLVDAYVGGLFAVPPLTGYTDALDQLGLSYDVWDSAVNGSPSLSVLEDFQAILWRLPDFGGAFSSSEQATLSAYLDLGGSLFVASMEGLSRLDEAQAVPFRTNILHVESFAVDRGVPTVVGEPGEPIGAGAHAVLDYTPYDDPWKDLLGIPSDISDTIIPTPDAAPILREPSSGETVGLRFPRVGADSPGRVVFLSFPLDALPFDSSGDSPRTRLLRNVLHFLAPAPGVGQIEFDRTAYTIPSLVTIEVTDTDLAGQGEVAASFASDSAPTGRTLRLQETLRPGLFRGSITLVPGTLSAPGPDEWPASHGDTIWAEYADASPTQTVRATSLVETNAPMIAQVAVEADFVEAIVRWTTTEPTDALVQFGQSLLLGRTAYRGGLRQQHTITLSGLQPDRLYYYRVVSRDQAGNTATDDNDGGLYTFQTQQPRIPPWSDNLEGGDAEWQIVTGTESETHWQLRVPSNAHGVDAHSPTNAWGSNLDGASIGLVDTTLVSPPVALVAGSQATLWYQENYDFSFQPGDIWEVGQLLVLTNITSAPIPLRQVIGTSTGWEEVEVDLTPYVGQLIYLLWEYGLFSFQNSPRLGWLIDDITITMSGEGPSGTIRIANNLAQARWGLAGPVQQSGQGLVAAYSNVPIGTYVLTYATVPYYLVPPPQTHTLEPSGTIDFHGQYLIADGNTNGISDDWEEEHFGSIDPARTIQTDTDRDGLTDRDEFIAGTDPNDTNSALRLSVTPPRELGHTELDWTSATGRIYRVERSLGTQGWTPASHWIHATSGTVTYPVQVPDSGTPVRYRFEVRP